MFNFSNLTAFVFIAICCLFLYKLILYPAFISPLARIPNATPTAGFSWVWIFWKRYRQQEVAAIHKAHLLKGPIVRLGPNEVSVNCVKGGIQIVYSGGFEKGIPDGNWYHLFSNFDVDPMFAMARNQTHAARKRMLSNIYSKSSVSSSRMLSAFTVELLKGRLLPYLHSVCRSEESINICAVFSAVTMDLVTGYLFGSTAGSNMIRDINFRDHFLDLYTSREDYGYWEQEWPKLSNALYGIGYSVSPKHVHNANAEIENWCLSMCDAADALLRQGQSAVGSQDASPAEFPVVYAQLKAAMQKDAANRSEKSSADPERQRLEIASELLDHLAAGYDTSSITLTFLAQELSRPHNTDVLTRLQSELCSLEVDAMTGLPSVKDLDKAPLLHAVLYETLRLHAAIPGPQPRRTPNVSGGTTLGPNAEYPSIPGGVRVSAQAHSLHRNPEVFPEPETWDPDRWLVNDSGKVTTESIREMMRWFWAFGSGPRMCVGSNLAIYRK